MLWPQWVGHGVRGCCDHSGQGVGCLGAVATVGRVWDAQVLWSQWVGCGVLECCEHSGQSVGPQRAECGVFKFCGHCGQGVGRSDAVTIVWATLQGPDLMLLSSKVLPSQGFSHDATVAGGGGVPLHKANILSHCSLLPICMWLLCVAARWS